MGKVVFFSIHTIIQRILICLDPSVLFFFCSEDGFYTTWVKAPREGGQWSVEAVSLSPFHGLRMAQTQPLLRTIPVYVAIGGIPTSLKRGEILRNVTIRTRNNMPVPMKVLYHFRTFAYKSTYSVSNINMPFEIVNISILAWFWDKKFNFITFYVFWIFPILILGNFKLRKFWFWAKFDSPKFSF